MKRTILIWVLAITVIATGMALQYRPFGTFDVDKVDVREVSLHDHLYVVAAMRGLERGGVSIIHSEACPCKNKKK